MKPKLVLVLAAALLTGCAAKRTVSEQTTPAAQEEPLPRGETIYLISTAIDGNSAGIPQATIDSGGDVCFLLGVRVHVEGLTPAEATAAVKKAHQPRYFIDWDFVVARVQPKAAPNGGPTRRSGNSGVTGGPPSVS